MSIIVAIRKNNQTVIACDGLSSVGSMNLHADNLINSSKLIELKNCVIGIAGWSALQDIVTHLSANKPELFEFDTREQLFSNTLQIHEELTDTYHINTAEDSEQPVDSSQIHMLIANKDSIFEVESYRTVVQYDKYFAIGSGARFALGALHSLYDRLEDPEEIARAAIEASCYYSDSCGLPIYLENLNKRKTAQFTTTP